MDIEIRTTCEGDVGAVRRVHEGAFGVGEGEVIGALAVGLLGDATAEPVVSLLAERGGEAVGHVIFTRVRIKGDGGENFGVDTRILAPLAVIPSEQGCGIGSGLVKRGLGLLKAAGCGLVFVYGDPGYYGRFGFGPAMDAGLTVPYEIPVSHRDAWMVLGLQKGLIGGVRGVVRCAASLDKPEHWVVD